MKRYRNLHGQSGVAAYEYGDGFIRIRFVNGDAYEYTDEATGREHVANTSRTCRNSRKRASASPPMSAASRMTLMHASFESKEQ